MTARTWYPCYYNAFVSLFGSFFDILYYYNSEFAGIVKGGKWGKQGNRIKKSAREERKKTIMRQPRRKEDLREFTGLLHKILRKAMAYHDFRPLLRSD
jgi:hypothetical protein